MALLTDVQVQMNLERTDQKIQSAVGSRNF